MQTQNDSHNYMLIPMDELPSQGFFYPEGSFIKGRFLTIQDVKYTTLINEYNATRIVNEIIDRCFVTNIPTEDLLLCDREYLALWLRANSFMKENGYHLHVEHCKHCNRGFDVKISLDSIPIKYLSRMPGDVILPKSKRTIRIKMPTIKDLAIVHDDAEIQLVARMIEVDNPAEYVENLNAYDYSYLVSYCKSFEAGFDLTFDLVCKQCGTINQMTVIMQDTGLFQPMSMRDIINLIIRVTKYVGCFIPDTTPWPELEMIQDVTNLLVKEENEEMAKQEQKSKAQAASMQAKYSSKSYHK